MLNQQMNNRDLGMELSRNEAHSPPRQLNDKVTMKDITKGMIRSDPLKLRLASALTMLMTGSVIAYLAMARSAFGMDFIVTNTAGSGPGSLRQAINDANSNLGPDHIKFNI